MSIVLKVTLDKSASPFLVVVDEKDKANHIPRSDNPQDITWELKGDAKDGDFVALTDPEPGFEWLTPPPDGIFSGLQPLEHGKKLQLQDLNDDVDTAGDWTYRLRIIYQGQTYSSEDLNLSTTIRDPIIVNK